MSKLILLVGNKASVDPVAPHNPLEPYRVIWNPQVMLGNISEYKTDLSDGLWGAQLKNTAVLTYNDPLGYEPVMLTSSSDPVDSGFNGYPMIGSSRPLEGTSAIRINDIVKIAHPDRRDILPKVFQIRIASAGEFPDLHLMKYSLNADGSRYVSLRAMMDNAGQLSGRISICLDGITVINSNTVNLANVVVSPATTDSIRLIIFDDRIVVHLSDPGTEVLSLPLPEPLSATVGAHFDIFLEDGNYSNAPANFYAIDGLYIYDGYY